MLCENTRIYAQSWNAKMYWKANISPSGVKSGIKKELKQKQKQQHVKYALDNK